MVHTTRASDVVTWRTLAATTNTFTKLENGTCIDLSVKGIGGGGESDSSTGKVLA